MANAYIRGQPAGAPSFAEDLERIVALHGARRFAAVIVEPMAGRPWVLLPPVRLSRAAARAVHAANGIILIFDEVINRFAGLARDGGKAIRRAPDMITLAKGLTNAAVPMGAVAVSRTISDEVVGAHPTGSSCSTRYTYSCTRSPPPPGWQRSTVSRRNCRAGPGAEVPIGPTHSLLARGHRHIIDCARSGWSPDRA